MHDGGSISILQSLLLSLCLLEKLIGMLKSGSSFCKRQEGLRSSKELEESVLCTERKAWPRWQNREEQLVCVCELRGRLRRGRQVGRDGFLWALQTFMYPYLIKH